MAKRLAMIFVLVAFATTGCGAEAPAEEVVLQDDVGTLTKTLNDGQVVECLYFIGWKAGGLWCTPSENDGG